MKEKRKLHVDKEATRIAEEAHKNPFMALIHKKNVGCTTIDMDTWENHFSNILSKHELKPTPIQPTLIETHNNIRFTVDETRKAINKSKN